MVAVSPVRLLVKVPVPEPSRVLLLVMVGVLVVLQQTPRSVTVALPSLVTLPPPEAVVWVMLVIAEVVTTGTVRTGEVVKETWLP